MEELLGGDHVAKARTADTLQKSPTTGLLYQPLDPREIRLVKHSNDLSIASLISTISLQLCVIGLDQAPAYVALSYMWGDASNTQDILVNGQTVSVRKNLALALISLQKSLADGSYIWIDAICINQENSDDKNSQIPLMGTIFKKAQCVFAWLGEAGENSDLGMDLINRWGAALRAGRATHNKETPMTGPELMKSALGHLQDPFNDDSWQALLSLLKRPYWNRMWIIQEVVLASEVSLVCGEDIASFHDFCEFQFAAYGQLRKGYQSAHDNPFWPILRGNQVWTYLYALTHFADIYRVLMWFREELASGRTDKHRLGESTLITYIRKTHRYKATDPKDRIYALLGLLDPSDMSLLPDYSRPYDAICTDLLQTYIGRTNRLEPICLGGLGTHSSSSGGAYDRPSWIPNPDAAEFSQTPLVFCSSGHKASGDMLAQCRISADRQLLCAAGVICDEIAATFPAPTSADLPEGDVLFSWGESIRAHFRHHSLVHPTGVPWRQVYFRTVTAWEYRLADPWWLGNGQDLGGILAHAMTFIDMLQGWTLLRLRQLRESGSPSDMDQFLGDVDRDDWWEIVNHQPLNEWVRACVLWFRELPDLTEVTSGEAVVDALLKPFSGDKGSRNPKQPIIPFISGVIPTRDSWHMAFGEVYIPMCSRRHLFITNKGYIGLGSSESRPNDKVCVLRGCTVPLVIRQSGSMHKIVGESYVYGMMQGEMLNAAESGTLRMEELVFS
jgi:Heterokaryon incompatibility protein (HET)